MAASPIRILLIEDNPGDARLIREMLLDDEQARFILDIQSTLADGVQQTRHNAYDVILLDLSLPDSVGIDTLATLRGEVSSTAIVVLTGNDDQQRGILAVQTGAQDYLPKGSVDSKLLRRSLWYAIERHRAEADLRQSEEAYRSLIDDVFDTSMVGVIILDRSFQVVWCNAATEIYFGFERGDILGEDKRLLIDSRLKCIFADPDDYSVRLLKAYDEQSFTDRFECHVLPSPNRDERWLEHWSQPIRSGMYEGGRIEQYTDITDRKMLEFAELEQRQFAEGLRDIAALLTSTLDLNEVLGRILVNLDRIVPHDSAAITMLEPEQTWVSHRQHDTRRGTQEIVAEKQLQSEYAPYVQVMVNTRKPTLVGNLQYDERVKEAAAHANVRAFVGAPISLQHEVIGVINVFSEKANFYDETHSEQLLAFAELAAIAIQNARLYQQSQNFATLEERQRLARDLHDSVSQTLFTCRAMAESALRRWEKDAPGAKALLDEVHQLTVTALAEMRILLLELRPVALAQVPLKELFEQYLQPIQDRREFDLSMQIEDVPPQPPEVQIAIYRIAQEALNNIDKHARARHVNVSLRDGSGLVELEISDDGVGFDVAQAAPISLGLNIMRERAESIGAALHVESSMGEGTRIRILWNKTNREEPVS